MNAREVMKLVNEYASAERSDTFASYNDAIELSKYILRLQKKIEGLEEEIENLKYEVLEANERRY